MLEKIERNRQIFKDKETMTYREMSKKYNLAQNTLVQIINRERTRKLLQEK
jgi:Mor family transcriptional regulator